MTACDHMDWAPACPFCSAPALPVFLTVGFRTDQTAELATLEQMLDANKDDADICAELRAMVAGDKIKTGGGAAAEGWVECVQRRLVVAVFDVTSFDDNQLDSFTGELAAQAEASDHLGGHPDAGIVDIMITGDEIDANPICCGCGERLSDDETARQIPDHDEYCDTCTKKGAH